MAPPGMDTIRVSQINKVLLSVSKVCIRKNFIEGINMDSSWKGWLYGRDREDGP